MFTQKPEEPEEWAGLPSEPFDREDPTDLPAPPTTDPFGLGLGVGAGSGGISVPIVPGVIGSDSGGSGTSTAWIGVADGVDQVAPGA